MQQADALLERIETFHHAVRGEIVVRKVARGYSLFSTRMALRLPVSGPPARPTRFACCGGTANAGGTSGPFSIVTIPLDKALNYIATDPAFWIHA